MRTRRIQLRLPGLFLALALGAGFSTPAAAVRVKDLADVEGMRENFLFGYGVVVGLPGTGDTEQVFFTSQSVSSMLGRLGIRIDPKQVRTRNVAAVMVTARLPTFSRTGSALDVSVSAIGNARSLAGGVLLVTPLQGSDGQVYAVAQGPTEAGGFDARAAGSRISRNMPTTGRIPGGAVVEKSVAPDLGEGPVRLGLKQPDFTTAARMAEAIDAALGEDVARALDPATVEVRPPAGWEGSAVGLVARLETVDVRPDQRAKVVVNERTGTVVAGAEVRIREVAIAHGNLEVTIRRTPVISQPTGFSDGRTVRADYADVQAREERPAVTALPATSTVGELVSALNLLGASPRDLIAILEAMHAAGALDAELEVI